MVDTVFWNLPEKDNLGHKRKCFKTMDLYNKWKVSDGLEKQVRQKVQR